MGGRWVVQGVALSLQEVSGFEVSSESKQVSDWLSGSVRLMSGWVAKAKICRRPTDLCQLCHCLVE